MRSESIAGRDQFDLLFGGMSILSFSLHDLLRVSDLLLVLDVLLELVVVHCCGVSGSSVKPRETDFLVEGEVWEVVLGVRWEEGIGGGVVGQFGGVVRRGAVWCGAVCLRNPWLGDRN